MKHHEHDPKTGRFVPDETPDELSTHVKPNELTLSEDEQRLVKLFREVGEGNNASFAFLISMVSRERFPQVIFPKPLVEVE